MKMHRQLKICLAALVCLSLTSAFNAKAQTTGNSGNAGSSGSSSDQRGAGATGSTHRGAGSSQNDTGLSGSSVTSQSGSDYRQHRQGSQDETGMTGQPTKFNKASKLIGMSVQNQQGEDLGDIKDIVINLESGSVSYAVLSSGGVLGVGEKLLAVPLTAFKRSPDQRHLVLQASQSNISQAQGIGENWPSVNNPSFGAMPFWQQGSGSANSLSNQTPGSTRQNQRQY